MTRRILLVDDDPSSIRLMSHVLAELGEIQFATNGHDALRLAAEHSPGVIVLDAQMPGLSGYEVCEQLKADVLTADIPVIFVTSNDGAEFEVSGFDVGAADYVTKPVRPAALKARVATQLRLSEATAQLHNLALTDGLTGVANRRRFDDALASEWRRGRRDGAPLSLMLIDVDHFKRYNDHYGHPAGDTCLRNVALVLEEVCNRPGDLVARYGGEEFALLMPRTDRTGAWHVARQVLQRLNARCIEHVASPTARFVTVSVGMCSIDPLCGTWPLWTGHAKPGASADAFADAHELTRAADIALYAAKSEGRARAMLREFDALIPAHRTPG